MKITRFIICFLLAAFILGGCATQKPTPDPLAGFHFYSRTKVSQAITDDYQDYIKNLPSNEKGSIGDVSFFEDGTGQHAISIQVFEENNASWQHILIYNKEDKRIKAVRCDYRKYQS